LGEASPSASVVLAVARCPNLPSSANGVDRCSPPRCSIQTPYSSRASEAELLHTARRPISPQHGRTPEHEYWNRPTASRKRCSSGSSGPQRPRRSTLNAGARRRPEPTSRHPGRAHRTSLLSSRWAPAALPRDWRGRGIGRSSRWRPEIVVHVVARGVAPPKSDVLLVARWAPPPLSPSCPSPSRRAVALTHLWRLSSGGVTPSPWTSTQLRRRP
jgi:hypothetical protein